MKKNSIQGNNMETKQKGNYNKKMLSYNLDDMNEDVDDTSIYLASSNYSKHDRRKKI